MESKHSVKIIYSLFLLAMTTFSAISIESPPEAVITNGLIQAHLYLPDAVNGYYRATRFDWSGVIKDLEYNGHSYYGQWFQKYSPTINDAIMGPVEAFDPIGFTEAKPGESFVKVGVGELTKPDEMPYNFQTYYPIINTGKWKVNVKSDQVQFKQTLKGKDYAYEYSKTVKLIKNKPIMVLSHSLKNTGSKTIETTVFNHNFLVMDKQTTGPGFVITFPSSPLEKLNSNLEEFAKVQDNKLIFLKEPGRRTVSFKDLTDGKGAEYKINVENHSTGAGIKITGDQPISKLVFWSSAKTVCPEPYIKIKVNPGQTVTWNINYEYYNCDTLKTL